MVKTASLFSQVLQLFPRLEFEHAVQEHQAERYAKGLSCWQQFVAMLFCQLAQAHSLREICGGLDCCLGRLVSPRPGHALRFRNPLLSLDSTVVERRPLPQHRNILADEIIRLSSKHAHK